MKERRRYERFEQHLRTKIEVVSKAQAKETLDLFTRDICAGGAYFYISEPLPEGTEVNIGIVLQAERVKELTGNWTYIRAKGRVLRIEIGGMVVCFDKDYKISPLKELIPP